MVALADPTPFPVQAPPTAPIAARLESARAPDEVARAAEEFESFFLSQMYELMFSGIETDGPFGGGPGEAVFRSLLVSEYGKSTAARGGIGIADTIVRQLLAEQEATP